MSAEKPEEAITQPSEINKIGEEVTTQTNEEEEPVQFDHNSPEFQKGWAKIVAQAWADEQFKQRLFSDTNTVLKEHGIEVPEGVNLTINEAGNLSAPQGQSANKVPFFEERLNTEAIAVAAGAASSEKLSQPLTGGSTIGSAACIGSICGSIGSGGTAGSGGAGLTLPQAPPAASSEKLSQPLTGGGTAGTGGTAGCFGTVCGTAGSMLCAGSAGTGGSGLTLPQPPESTAHSTSLQQPMTGGGTAGSGGSIGTVGTYTATVGTFGTTGSAGSAGVGLTLPQAPPASSSEKLSQPMQGGSTAGTGGTGGTAGTICSTIACVFCAGTAGSAGAVLNLPQAPEDAAQSTSLQQPVTGGGCAGSAGSIGCIGCFTGTTGSFACAGSAGSGGSGLTLPEPPQSVASSTSLQQPMTGGSTAGSGGTLGSVGSMFGTLGSVLCSGTAGTGGSGLTLPQVPPAATQSTPLAQPMTGGGDDPVTATVGTVGSLLPPGQIASAATAYGTAQCVPPWFAPQPAPSTSQQTQQR